MCWLIILIHPFLLFPMHFYARKTLGKKKRTFELPQFVDLDQVQCPRQTWDEGEIWESHPHSNDKMYSCLSRHFYVLLHLIFTLGLAGEAALSSLGLRTNRVQERLATIHTLSPEAEGKNYVLSSSLGLFLLNHTEHSDTGANLWSWRYWSQYAQGKAS